MNPLLAMWVGIATYVFIAHEHFKPFGLTDHAGNAMPHWMAIALSVVIGLACSTTWNAGKA